MDFRVLGQLEIADGPRTLRLGAPTQRALLGHLLLTADRALTVDDITERVWDTRAPARPRGAVQLLVLRVRRALQAFECSARIDALPGAYRLVLGDDSLDADRFTALVRRAAAARDPAAERTLLDEALAVWRGPVLGERLDWRSAPEAGELTRLRVTAGERLASIEIAAGRHDVAIATARTFLRDDASRERLWYLLVLALHCAGRRGEALAAYDEAYRRTVDELGLDPGQDLRRLQLDILEGNPPDLHVSGLDESARSALSNLAGPPATVDAGPADDGDAPVIPQPAVLPMRLPGFVGRRAVIRRVEAVLRRDATAGVAVCGLSGMAGVGKSALALHVAHDLRAEFPDGQLFADLGGGRRQPTPVDDVLLRFLRLLGMNDAAVPDGVEARAELFRARTSGRRLLVVLDDAATAAQVRDLLPGAGRSAVLITSRTALTGVDGSSWFPLDVLDDGESIAVLANLVGSHRVRAAPDSAIRVVEYCGRLPLALRIAGARLAARPTWSLTRLADQLADQAQRLDRLVLDDLAVRTSIGVSHRLCTPEQRRALRLLGLLDQPWFSWWAVAALMDTDTEPAVELVEALVDAQLVQVRSENPATGVTHYQLHDLVRLFAREEAVRAESEPGRRAALSRLLDATHVLTAEVSSVFLARRHVLTTQPPPEYHPRLSLSAPDSSWAHTWLDAEMPALIAIAEQGCAIGLTREATGLMAVLDDHLELYERTGDQVRLHAAGLVAAVRAGDERSEAAHHAALAVLLHRGPGDGVELRSRTRADELLTDLDDRSGLARAALTRAVATSHTSGRPADARDELQAAVALVRRHGDEAMLGEALLALSSITGWHGEHAPDDTLADVERAIVDSLAAFERAGDRYGEARVRGLMLVPLHLRRGAIDAAGESADRIAELARETRSPNLTLITVHTRAEIAMRRGDLEHASAVVAAALELATRHGVTDIMLRCLQHTAEIDHASGRIAEAEANYRRIASIAQQTQVWVARSLALNRLADLCAETGRPEDAAEYRRAAAEITGAA